MNRDLKAFLDGTLKESKVITVLCELNEGNVSAFVKSETPDSKGNDRYYSRVKLTGLGELVNAFAYVGSINPSEGSKNVLHGDLETFKSLKKDKFIEAKLYLSVKDSELKDGEDTFIPNLTQIQLKSFAYARQPKEVVID
jgi:hypothetical protein